MYSMSTLQHGNMVAAQDAMLCLACTLAGASTVMHELPSALIFLLFSVGCALYSYSCPLFHPASCLSPVLFPLTQGRWLHGLLDRTSDGSCHGSHTGLPTQQQQQ